MEPITLSEKLDSVPNRPGCYLYKNEAGDILYVGKAVSLRNRVRSYFQKSAKHSAKTRKLVNDIRDLEIMVTDSELEALILECTLIKRHRPKYNVRLRDDKSYPYLALTTSEAFPRLLYTRRVNLSDGNRYFGPYTNSQAVRQASDLLHKIFPLTPCGKVWNGKEERRPCLYYHMGQCMGACAGLADHSKYQKIVKDVTLFLEGKHERLLKELRRNMETAAEKMEFERAAKLRDQVAAIEEVMQRQKVISNEDTNQDVIAVVKDERGAAVQMFYVRGGKLIGQRVFILDGGTEESASEAVQEFVKRYYNEAPEIPREILLPVIIEDMNIIETWLRQKRGHSVQITVPRRGAKFDMVEMAASNAEIALQQMRQQIEAREEWAEAAMSSLQEVLSLENLPMRIEGFDISNTQGKIPVGSMVVAEEGQPARSEYRRFKIKWHAETPDDFAMMKEVITRRLRAAVEGNSKFSKLPDLMLIDGGKGQLSAALAAMKDVEIDIPVLGLAKQMELIFMSGRDAPIALPRDSSALHLLQRLRDEAHRFALQYHRKLRDANTFSGNPLDNVPGIGPRRKRTLLRTFGSVARIREATIEELAAVPGMTTRLAEQVKELLG
jgi:excinuclease ABC subunit C